MLERVKNGVAILLGLAIGLGLALPLVWFGVREGVGRMHRGIEKQLDRVVERQNEMADEVLRLEGTLASLGWRRDKEVFAEVELRRAQLQGSYGLLERLEAAQALDRALVASERAWARVQGRARESIHWKLHGLTWDRLKRLQVREQKELETAVIEYGLILHRWPATTVAHYASLGEMGKAFFVGAWDQAVKACRQAWNWMRWSGEWAWAKLRSQPLPERPKAVRAAARRWKPLYGEVPRPVFIADAPLPEDEYKEVQYAYREVDYASIDVGEEPPRLQVDQAPEPYKVVVPTVQKTVDYR